MKNGDKVICINNVGAEMLIKDKIYTVLKFVPKRNNFDCDGITLYEANTDKQFEAFRIDRFRKIDTKWIDELMERIKEEVDSELLVDAL